MKIINFGETYEIYPDDLKTFDVLPAGTYKIHFHPMSGFSLKRITDFVALEEKTYGSHPERIEKIMKAYDQFERSLGVIFSGDKGMGKSLSTQLLAVAAIERGIPVVLVPKAFKGVADFIEKIDQEVLVIFDEFEKVFPISRSPRHGQQPSDSLETQEDLLGLFDGTSQRKRIYVVTVNNLTQVNEFMVSRTGRFHYHIRFDYPTADEIEIYLADKLEEQYHEEIKHVVAFATRVKLNYDSLRAIAFELNNGYTFKSSISDLNILTTDLQSYDFQVLFNNGKSSKISNQRVNLFAESIRVDGYSPNDDYFNLSFDSSAIHTEGEKMIIAGDTVKFNLHNDEGDDSEKELAVHTVVISKHRDVGVNYNL